MTALSDELCEQHLTAIPDAAVAFRDDPQFHAEVTMLRDVLDQVDRALTIAGTDAASRRGQLDVLLRGIPDVGQALERISQTNAARRAIGEGPRPTA